AVRAEEEQERGRRHADGAGPAAEESAGTAGLARGHRVGGRERGIGHTDRLAVEAGEVPVGVEGWSEILVYRSETPPIPVGRSKRPPSVRPSPPGAEGRHGRGVGRQDFGLLKYATRFSGLGPGTTWTSSQPSSPKLSRICLVLWISSGAVRYSHFVMAEA